MPMYLKKLSNWQLPSRYNCNFFRIFGYYRSDPMYVVYKYKKNAENDGKDEELGSFRGDILIIIVCDPEFNKWHWCQTPKKDPPYPPHFIGNSWTFFRRHRRWSLSIFSCKIFEDLTVNAKVIGIGNHEQKQVCIIM